MNLRDVANGIFNATETVIDAGQRARKRETLAAMSEADAEAHRTQRRHIHDLEYYDVTYNCIGMDVATMIGDGCFTLDKALRHLNRAVVDLANRQSGGIGLIDFDADISRYVGDETDDEMVDAFSEFFEDLNLNSRRGCENPYVTLNFGLATDEKAKRVVRAVLKVARRGRADGGSYIFPNLVFKLREGVNMAPGDPNYDLFGESARCTAERMVPTYLNTSSSANVAVDPRRLGVMGCRSRVVSNVNGECGSLRRGNVASVTINLVQLAYLAKGDTDMFVRILQEEIAAAGESLRHRMDTLAAKGDFDAMFSNGYYLGSEERDVASALKNGTLAVAFIGLWDALSVLHCVRWETVDDMRPYENEAYAFIAMMRKATDEMTERYGLNFSLLGAAAEGVTGSFAGWDAKHLGEGNSVSEKGYYTNSFHVPVEIKTDFFTKLKIEGRFHALCNGGSISYVEFGEMPMGNPEAIIDIVTYGCKSDCNYIGINFPLDHCRGCGHTGRIVEKCPVCGCEDVSHLRRVSGYLSEVDAFTDGKKKELRNRTASEY